MPSASSYFLHVFCCAENPYQTKSKRDKKLRRIIWNICDFLDLESMQTEAHSAHETPGHASVGCALLGCRLGLYFGLKEAYIWKKIMLKF